MNDKETGSFYTPKELIEYMVTYTSARIKPKTILEPSAGDGRFVEPLKKFNAQISLVEFDSMKAASLSSTFAECCTVHCIDFIKYANQCGEKYDLIIGNPPYIAKKKVPENQCLETEKILKSFNLDKSIFQNLWVSFVISSIKLLSADGAIFFVLPFEFLQVHYAEKLRAFLETKFNTIEIITFEERVFEGIEQDICLVYLSNEPKAKAYIQYTTFKDVFSPTPVSQSKIMRNKPLKKWSNCILNDEETEKLLQLSKGFLKISQFGDISPGIVTGANSFFILNQEKIDKLKTPATHILPIIMKSSSIPPLLSFTSLDFENTISKNNRTHLLNLNGLAHESFSKELVAYIAKGEDEKINERYKCKKRRRWYDVPIIKKGDVCFFKRYVHEIRGSTNTLGLKIVMAKEELEYDKNIEGALKYIDEAITCQQSFGSWFKVTIESVKKDRRTMKDVNLPQLLDNLKASWEDTCPDTGISVECDPITFRCFPYEIESLVNNLVANSTSAFKSVNQVERKIHIKVSQRDNFIDIFYQDNGPGLSTKYKKNPDLIMDAMETDKMDADGEIIGTGMGMWIIGKTVRDYKGTIDLSENIDAEVGFHVTVSLKGRR